MGDNVHTKSIEPLPRSTLHAPANGARLYTNDEDDLIVKLRGEGVSWDSMAMYFNDRTPGSLSTHWYVKLRGKARQSLPAPTSASAGLLRKALNNSRRQSDTHQGSLNEVLDSNAGNGKGNVNDLIIPDEDIDMNAASEQLFGEWQSSVEHEPSPASNIDREEPVLPTAASAQALQQLIQAAEQFAAQQNNPHVVQRVKDAYQSSADDSGLQKLLELTTSDTSNTPSEIEWAFEAFDHSYEQAERLDHDLHRTREPDPDVQTTTVRRDKGKGRERDLRPVVLPHSSKEQSNIHQALAPATTSRLPTSHDDAAHIQSHIEEQNRSPQCSTGADTDASTADDTPSRYDDASCTGDLATQIVPDISSDSSDDDTEPLVAFLSAGEAKLVVSVNAQGKPIDQGAGAKDFQSPQDAIPEESLGIPPRPKHSFAELIRMAMDATQARYMHPKTICTWIETNFEYYRAAPPNWKAGILMELNANDDFEQLQGGASRAKPWRIKAVPASSLVGSDKETQHAELPTKGVEAAITTQNATSDDYTIPCSDNDADADIDDADDNIVVRPRPKKVGRPRGKPRGKRTTDSPKDVRAYKASLPSSVAKDMPTRNRLRSQSQPVEVKETSPVKHVPELDLSIEIANSDGADELSSTPAQVPEMQGASSGKKVRFVDTVEVRGPARASAVEATPSSKRQKRSDDESDAQKPDGGPASPAKPPATASPTKSAIAKPKAALPNSSSPAFMRLAGYGNNAINRSKAVAASTGRSTPIPKARSRLSQLRRESTGVGTPPRTPVANWPRRHSTPTAIFSHRASPALGRGVMMDRFGFGRKRVVETPVRELAMRKDVEEDELA
jgi:hypothetical protein